MIASSPVALSPRHSLLPAASLVAAGPEPRGGLPGAEAGYWLEPGTGLRYPMSFYAYRRAREAEEKPPPRHRALAPDIDLYVWRRGWGQTPEVEVLLTVHPDASPRIQRMVADILRAIRGGRSAADAIRQVSRRFGLRQACARAFITGCIGFELKAREGAPAPLAATR